MTTHRMFWLAASLAPVAMLGCSSETSLSEMACGPLKVDEGDYLGRSPGKLVGAKHPGPCRATNGVATREFTYDDKGRVVLEANSQHPAGETFYTATRYKEDQVWSGSAASPEEEPSSWTVREGAPAASKQVDVRREVRTDPNPSPGYLKKRLDYDGKGRLVKETSYDVEQSRTAITHHEHDNQVRSVKTRLCEGKCGGDGKPGEEFVTERVFDPNGLVLRSVAWWSDSLRVQTFDYDDAGNLIRRTDRALKRGLGCGVVEDDSVAVETWTYTYACWR